MELNKIYNEDCLYTMQTHIDEHSVDVVLTSPPYNTSRSSSKSDPYSFRYDSYKDSMSDDEYIDFICKCFDGYDRVLKKMVVFCLMFRTQVKTQLLFGISSQTYNEEPTYRLLTVSFGKRNALYQTM